jgi:hypothetical protein
MTRHELAAAQPDPWLRIDLRDPEGLAFWACLLEVDASGLARAVRTVGGDVHAVADHLRALALAQARVPRVAGEAWTPSPARRSRVRGRASFRGLRAAARPHLRH